MIAAWSQVGALAALLIAAYWLAVYPHDDDGIDVPLRRLAERQAWMSRFDPGLAVTA